MTTFFDVPAVSPSGRYLALTRVPFLWRRPLPGDLATVYVVDRTDRVARAVYHTSGWGTQLGAGVQWGRTDDDLFCNDVIDGVPRGVRLDRRGGATRVLDGTIYGLPRSGAVSYSPDLRRINEMIPGYGVPDPLFPPRRAKSYADANEGIWRTDLETGKRDLLVSLETLLTAAHAAEPVSGGRWSVFHVKPNPQGTRCFAILFGRDVPGRFGTLTQLVTLDTDGMNIRLALPDATWRHGGHHPNWTQDGERIVMNLRAPGERMRFVSFRPDGTSMRTIAQGHPGSGHPSLNAAETMLLADAYAAEGFANGAGEVPIRLIQLATGAEIAAHWVRTKRTLGPRRVDPHPVWTPGQDAFHVNAVVGGHRQVLSAEISDPEALFPRGGHHA
jgi:hypothetical protein